MTKKSGIHWWVFALALGWALAGAPEEARADTKCTEQYLLCLNEAEQMKSPAREAAEIECAAEWVGCVARKIRFS